MIFEFFINVALLTSLFSLYGLLEKQKNKVMHQILSGFLFGSIAIAGMVFRFQYQSGIIYDGRSIILCLAGLFGGGPVSLIAIIMTSVYRIYLGGVGIWAGLLTIIVTSLIGLLARSYYNNRPEKITLLNLYLLGIVAHIGMIFSQLLIPWPNSLHVISKLWLPVLSIYPVATMLIGFLIKNETERSIVKPENKKFEAQLKLLSSAINSSSNAIIISNDKEKIEWVNIGFTNQTGYSFEEAVNKNTGQLLDLHKDNTELDLSIANKVSRGESWTGEIENVTKEGKIFIARTSITPFIDENTNQRKYISIKEDITELKKTQTELIKANRIKDGFISNISHEIRTPLNAITGFTALIKDKYGSNQSDDDKMIFNGVENASERLIKTVEMILNFSRLQAGELKPTKKQLDILDICKNLESCFGNLAKDKNISLSVECTAANTKIFADDYQISESISDLISNAIKFTDHGFVKLQLYNNCEQELLLDIIDSGIGIAPEHLGFIFQPYSQTEMGYSRKYEGVGLGLAIAKKYIELNNFNISVASEQNSGTIFTINLGKSVS